FESVLRSDSFHFKQNLSRTNYCYPVIRRSFAFAHTGFSRLFGDGLIWEQANPNLATALDEPGHGYTTGFNLAIGDPSRLKHFEAVISERQFASAPCLSGHASALLLAVLHFFWHQHRNQFSAFNRIP